MRLKYLFPVLLLFLTAFYSNAQTGGKVYLITNFGKPTVSMASSSSGSKAIGASTNANDPKQQWYLIGDAGTGYYFRNVATGAYLSSPNTTSQQWTLEIVSTPNNSTMLMNIGEVNGNKVIHVKKDNAGYGYAHCDASSNIVCWETGNTNTQWKFIDLEFTDEQIDEILDSFHSTADEIARAGEYENYLDQIFEDKSCTKLIEGVELEGNPAYEALPLGLRKMADKIKVGDWSEVNSYGGKSYDWDSPHAEKYRVQLYEPYSEGSNGASMVGIQAYTNMNNPTGILADANDMLYVMVEDDIQPGASLYISGFNDTGMHNSVNDGTKLHKGLNIVRCIDDNSHFFIYYSVATANNRQHTEYKVTEFPDIKIHIEGGRINGFFNYIGDELYEKDTRKDLEYTVMRATHPMYDLIGRYVILHLHLEDTPSQEGEQLQKCLKSSLVTDPTLAADRTQDPVAIMQSWDNMCFAERILMGLQSDKDIENPFNLGYYESIVGDGHTVTDGVNTYSTDPGYNFYEYFNNRMMGISQQGTLFMNATSWRTAYNVSTIDAILTLFPSGNIWGPAHEYGHMNQGPMNMAGTTEVSNNIFSNVAMYYAGVYSSRCEFPSAQLKNFQEGKTYLEAGTWGTTRMFWQLWCYYHATGHNKKFYPRLYQLLRQYPLQKTVAGNGVHNERYDMLHFAKMCCIAAEEDLTNFFEVWGFFVPLDGYKIDDYSVYNAVLSQDDIDAVKAEIKAFGFPKNDVIILIDDRPGSTRTSYPDFPISKAGDLGGLKDFNSESGAQPSGDYSFKVDMNTVTVETDGNKGVGYLIYDEDGNLLGFYNTNSFDVPDELAEKLRNGEARIEVMGEDKDNSLTVTNTLLDGTPERKRSMLADIIASCDRLLSTVDETDSKVGYLHYQPSESLQFMRDDAQVLVDNESEDGEELTRMINNLSQLYQNLAGNEQARIVIEPGATYRIANMSTSFNRVLSTMEDCNKTTNLATPIASSAPLTAEADPYTQQWIFEEGDADGVWYLKNAWTGMYVNIAPSYMSNTIVPMSNDPHSYNQGSITGKTGVFYLAPDNRTSSSLHMNASGNIYHYVTSSDNTQWSITKIHSADYMNLREEILTQIEESRKLLNEIGEVTIPLPEKMNLTSSNLSANAVQKSGNGAFRSWNDILDGVPTTYFASDRTGANSSDGLDHYIKIEAPEGETFNNFVFTFYNNSFQTNAGLIYSYRIEASTDGNSWVNVFEANEGLDQTYSMPNSTELISVPDDTKYIRFMVTKSGEMKALHYSYLISDIKVENAHTVYTSNPEYKSITAKDMENLGNKIATAEFAVKNPATTDDELLNNLRSLVDTHEALAEKLGIETSVNPIWNDSDALDEYYRLDGTRLIHPEKGIIIHKKGNTVTKERL